MRRLIRALLSRLSPASRRARSLPGSGWVEVERQGLRWRLLMDRYIDRTIAIEGVFEPDTTRLIGDMVKPGMHVLDVGANVGYYTLLLARAVGPTGRVWAFEPTPTFIRDLRWHVDHNGFRDRVVLLPFGLSDRNASTLISIDDVSATLHWAGDGPAPAQELIELRPLDECVVELGLSRIDFIKVDVDGHEPQLLEGARETLRRFQPTMVMELAQHCLHVAHSDVRDVARQLSDLDYDICDERTREPYPSEMAFLRACANFDRSANVLLLRRARA
jgi:FkbM family methyltransferase